MLQRGTNLYSVLTQLQTAYPSLSAESQAEANLILNQAEQLLEDERIRFYVPNSAQQAYIDAVGNPLGYIVIFAAANGIGKTAATAAILAAIIWPELAPQQYFKSWVYQQWPYPKDVRIVSTPQQIGEGGSVQREIKRWFPKGQYSANKNGKPYLSQYLAKDFTINLMSYDMAVEAFEGATCGLVIFDEPPPKAIFNACAARMRKGGRLLFPGTPLIDAAWVMDDLVSKADGEYIQLVSGDIEANCADHSKNGLLKHSDIARMLAAYDPDELEARRDGKFMHLSGRILKSFDRSRHVVEKPFPEVHSRFHVVDPAIGKPLAMLWAWADPKGSVHIYDEWPEFQFEGAKDSDLTVKDYASLIRARENGRQSDVRILDRHFGNARRTLGGPTLKEQFDDEALGDLRLEFIDSYTMSPEIEVETGIQKVKDYLKHDASKPIDPLNFPRLTIDPKCKNTIAAMERWSRNPKTSKPAEEYKDFADLVRYLVMSEPRYEAPTVWKEGKRPFYGVSS